MRCNGFRGATIRLPSLILGRFCRLKLDETTSLPKGLYFFAWSPSARPTFGEFVKNLLIKYVDTTEAKQYHPQPLEVGTRDKREGFPVSLCGRCKPNGPSTLLHVDNFRSRSMLKDAVTPAWCLCCFMLASTPTVRACLTCPPLYRLCWATEL